MMNDNRRNNIRDAISLLERANDILTNAQEEEQDCIENMPESLQNTLRFEKMEEADGYLGDAISSIDDAIESANNAME